MGQEILTAREQRELEATWIEATREAIKARRAHPIEYNRRVAKLVAEIALSGDAGISGDI